MQTKNKDSQFLVDLFATTTKNISEATSYTITGKVTGTLPIDDDYQAIINENYILDVTSDVSHLICNFDTSDGRMYGSKIYIKSLAMEAELKKKMNEGSNYVEPDKNVEIQYEYEPAKPAKYFYEQYRFSKPEINDHQPNIETYVSKDEKNIFTKADYINCYDQWQHSDSNIIDNIIRSYPSFSQLNTYKEWRDWSTDRYVLKHNANKYEMSLNCDGDLNLYAKFDANKKLLNVELRDEDWDKYIK